MEKENLPAESASSEARYHPQFSSIKLTNNPEKAKQKITTMFNLIISYAQDYADLMKKDLEQLRQSELTRGDFIETFKQMYDLEAQNDICENNDISIKNLLSGKLSKQDKDNLRRYMRDTDPILCLDAIRKQETFINLFSAFRQIVIENPTKALEAFVYRRAIGLNDYLKTKKTFKTSELEFYGLRSQWDQRISMSVIHAYNIVIKNFLKLGLELPKILHPLITTLLKESSEQIQKTYNDDPYWYALDGLILDKVFPRLIEKSEKEDKQAVGRRKVSTKEEMIEYVNQTDFTEDAKSLSETDLMELNRDFILKRSQHRKSVEAHIKYLGEAIKKDNEDRLKKQQMVATQTQTTAKDTLKEEVLHEYSGSSSAPKVSNRKQRRAAMKEKEKSNSSDADVAEIENPVSSRVTEKNVSPNLAKSVSEQQVELNVPLPSQSSKPKDIRTELKPKPSKNEKKIQRALARKAALDKLENQKSTQRSISPVIPEKKFSMKSKDRAFMSKIFDPQSKAFTLNFEKIQNVLQKLGVIIPDTSSKGDYRKVYYVDEDSNKLGTDFIYKPATPTAGAEFLKILRGILEKFSIKLENIAER